jgi:hypothetical protein
MVGFFVARSTIVLSSIAAGSRQPETPPKSSAAQYALASFHLQFGSLAQFGRKPDPSRCQTSPVIVSVTVRYRRWRPSPSARSFTFHSASSESATNRFAASGLQPTNPDPWCLEIQVLLLQRRC